MLQVVFDTVVFVRALLNPHSFSGRLLFEYLKDYRLFLSASLVEEILEVLGRKEIIERFHLRQKNLPKAMTRLIKSMNRAEIIQVDKIPAISRDVKDDKFLATARVAEADYIVSADRDLLGIKDYMGIKIIDAENFLHIIKEK